MDKAEEIEPIERRRHSRHLREQPPRRAVGVRVDRPRGDASVRRRFARANAQREASASHHVAQPGWVEQHQ